MKMRRTTITLMAVWGLLAAGTLHAEPPAPAAALTPGQVVRIGPTAGTGTPTREYGIGATDLCEFMEFPEGTLQVCGDTWAGPGVGVGGWYSPVALRVESESIRDDDGVRYEGVLGVARPLLADPTPPGTSQLPAGVVKINDDNYLMVTTARLRVPESSRLVKADLTLPGWQTVPDSTRPADYLGGRQSQVSGYYDPTPTDDSESGWVYIVANDFDRREAVVLYRVSPESFTDRSSWQGWSSLPGPDGGWGKPATPLWDERVGEMSIRQIEGKTVLSYFNASNGNMEVRVANAPTELGSAPVTTVVYWSEWPTPADKLPEPNVNRLAQPYGGYISPGSTLEELRIFISQWNNLDPTATSPYRVLQFAVNPFKPDS